MGLREGGCGASWWRSGWVWPFRPPGTALLAPEPLQGSPPLTDVGPTALADKHLPLPSLSGSVPQRTTCLDVPSKVPRAHGTSPTCAPRWGEYAQVWGQILGGAAQLSPGHHCWSLRGSGLSPPTASHTWGLPAAGANRRNDSVPIDPPPPEPGRVRVRVRVGGEHHAARILPTSVPQCPAQDGLRTQSYMMGHFQGPGHLSPTLCHSLPPLLLAHPQSRWKIPHLHRPGLLPLCVSPRECRALASHGGVLGRSRLRSPRACGVCSSVPLSPTTADLRGILELRKSGIQPTADVIP